MSLLFKIVYAAHANGTHHKLALDALRHLTVPQSDKWVKLFMKYSERYLEGSKDPDKVFKDFKNHVLHVRENYWGGADDKCREWYDDLVSALIAEKWEDAIYSAGVLSHYYTDPIMPFHTAQSDAESAIHRAVEWTINKNYNRLRKRADKDFKMLVVLPPEETIDLAYNMVREGALVSNRYYSHLIAHYNFDRGVVTPEEGYNELGLNVLAELIQYASRGFAVLLDEAIKASGKAPPPVSITAETFVAGLKIPARWVTAKLESGEDKKLVQSMYDELQETGKVEETLPEDDKLIRTLHRTEVLGIVPVEDDDEVEELHLVAETDDGIAGDDASLADDDVEDEPEEHINRRMMDRHEARSEAAAAMPDKRPAKGPTYFLEINDQVEDGPSIGPKTAKRLGVIGIHSVSDLLTASPEEVSGQLDVRYITAQLVKDWQDQALLQCEIPGLRGHDAQFLVGCGYRTTEKVKAANPETVLVDLHAFLKTSDGERLLRVGNEPDLEEVKSWIESAGTGLDLRSGLKVDLAEANVGAESLTESVAEADAEALGDEVSETPDKRDDETV